jgi:hypothetical protein
MLMFSIIMLSIFTFITNIYAIKTNNQIDAKYSKPTVIDLAGND